MTACVDAIAALPADSDALSAVAAMTGVLASRVDADLPAAVRPSAAVTIYAARLRQVWQVGDVGFHHAGLPVEIGQPRKLVDRIAAQFRAAVLAAEAAAVAPGAPPAAVTGRGRDEPRPGRTGPAGTGPRAPGSGDADPGRVAARALISRQGALRNVPGPYGYAGIDGRPVPPSMVVVHPLPPGVDELIIASDGYPEIHPTLARSEARLAELLAEDPHCVGALMGTKGRAAGQLSYDDRAYLRLRI